MKSSIVWTENMAFTGHCDGHQIPLDAKSPIGKGSAMTPKELIGLAITGCTAMDVVALMKKHKQTVQAFEVSIDIQTSKGGAPMVFTSAEILYQMKGEVEAARLIEAVQLSQTKYCGVSAMMTKAFPITYRIELNDQEIGRGEANFNQA